jgi:hypothetical protein
LRGVTDTPLDQTEAQTLADIVRTYAAAHNRAVVVAIIPLPDGTAIGEVMTIKNWGQDGLPHCTCGNDDADHICAHMVLLGHVLFQNDTYERGRDAGS